MTVNFFSFAFSEHEQQEDGMGREGREYWLEQLSEYWKED